MSLLLGIDLGTSYFKVGLFTAEGTLRGLGRVAVPKSSATDGRCELGINEFWTALRLGLAQALAQSGASAGDISGLSYSSQASTFVLLDGQDTPLTPLIVWLDTRGEPVPPEDAAFARSELFQRKIGFAGLSGQAAPAKWRWFQRHEPKLWARAARVMTMSDYFTYVLTGERVGDASTAAFLGLYDLGGQDWWPVALEHFGLDRTQLSRPLRPGTAVGRTLGGAEQRLGIPAGIPFAVGGLDHHVAAIGSGLGVLGEVSLSTGTVLAALALVSEITPTVGCFHGPHVEAGRFYRLAFDPAGAGQIEEYQRRTAPELSIEDLLRAAGDDALALSPHGNPALAHAAAVRDILRRIVASHHRLVSDTTDLATVRRVLATGGGARSPVLLQLDANALGRPVQTTACAERACLGAALFAAVAANHHPSLAAAAEIMVKPGATFEPVAREAGEIPRDVSGIG